MYLPGALQIGVDYGLFWRLTPKKLEPFLKAYESKQKEQLEFINIAGWVNGMYAGYSLGAAFGENVQYPEKPVQIFRSEEEIQETLTGKPNISAPMQLCSINSSKKKEEPHHAAM